MSMEYDLLLMTLCIFMPSAFALVLLFFPKGSEEYMRWWTLLGTAVTFVISTFLFIDYLHLLDANRDAEAAKAEVARASVSTGLLTRADTATKRALAAEKR